MKKIFCFAALAGLANLAFSQNTFPTASGTNAGIGTLSPTTKLNIVETAGLNPLLIQTSTNVLNETLGVSFGTQPGARTKAAIGFINTNTGNSSGALGFYTHNGTALTERGRLTADGYFGIGTSLPLDLVHIKGGNLTGLRIESAGATPIIDFRSSLGTAANRNYRIATNYSANGTFEILRSTADGTTPSVSDFAITSSGNIGIGTPTPATKLAVLQNNSLVPGALIQDSGTGDAGLAFNVSGASFTWGIDQSDAKKFKLSNSTTLGTTDFISISNVTGNVGIGTGNVPAGFKLAVNGSMIATSVTVKLYSEWPDYVFNKKYILPSLFDVEKFIEKNHHLPDMPSEKQISEKGLDLGEINKILTKKVEELTLYLIKKEKEDIKQQEQINLLLKSYKKLKTANTKIKLHRSKS